MQHDWKVLRATLLASVVVALTSTASHAQKKYDTGATDTEIKIGNIMPYSGPASAYGVIGKTCLLYTSPSPRDRQKYRMPSSA